MVVLREFVETCRSSLDHPDAAERVATALRPLLAEPVALSEAVETFRPPGGGPAVVHRSDDLTVLGLAVPAGFVSPVHDHTIWAVVGIYAGDEDNVFYRRDDDGISETGRAVLRCGEVLALPPDAVHRIANSGTTGSSTHATADPTPAHQKEQLDDDVLACHLGRPVDTPLSSRH